MTKYSQSNDSYLQQNECPPDNVFTNEPTKPFSASDYLTKLILTQESEDSSISSIEPFSFFFSQSFSTQSTIPFNQLAKDSQESDLDTEATPAKIEKTSKRIYETPKKQSESVKKSYETPKKEVKESKKRQKKVYLKEVTLKTTRKRLLDDSFIEEDFILKKRKSSLESPKVTILKKEIEEDEDEEIRHFLTSHEKKLDSSPERTDSKLDSKYKHKPFSAANFLMQLSKKFENDD